MIDPTSAFRLKELRAARRGLDAPGGDRDDDAAAVTARISGS